MFMDLLAYFGGCLSIDLYPFIKAKVDACLGAWKDFQLIKPAEDYKFGQIKRMCPYCGLLEDQFNVRYRRHLTTCKLESTVCDCPGVTFNNPTEKRRHYKLVHSGIEHLSCPHCSYICVAKNPETMVNHVAFNHGTSSNSRPEVCDLCGKGFKTPNHMRVHRLNHELYYCQICKVEILGRNANKAHLMKLHNSGFECDICQRKFLATKELNAHIKQAHSDSWRA